MRTIQSDEAFTYDPVGNRLTSAETSGEWTYNQNNELGGYDDVSFEYDANGNTIKKTAGWVVTSYVYNIENRLTEVWNGEAGTGSLIASYYYDPFGRRLWKEVGGVRTHFHYTDEGLIGEYDAAGDEIRTYGYKPGSTWTTDPLFLKENGQYYYYHNDHLGTPQKMTAVNGAVVWSALYSSFGEATVDVEVVENPLRFAGQYYDEETGLHYNFFRYFSPDNGRYLRVDPVGLYAGPNVYVYTFNNPLISIDELGMKCTLIGTTTNTTIDEKENRVPGEWQFASWARLNIGCVCVYRRHIRIDVTIIYYDHKTYIFECVEKDCDGYHSYIKFQTYTDSSVDKYSKYGGIETEDRYAAMYGPNDIDSGKCGCVEQNPPGLYQR